MTEWIQLKSWFFAHSLEVGPKMFYSEVRDAMQYIKTFFTGGKHDV